MLVEEVWQIQVYWSKYELITFNRRRSTQLCEVHLAHYNFVNHFPKEVQLVIYKEISWEAMIYLSDAILIFREVYNCQLRIKVRNQR